jgi:SPOR domain
VSDVTIPSYRVPRRERGGDGAASWRMLAVAGGLLGLLALAGAVGWALSGGGGGGLLRSGGGGGIPVVEPESRPVKVKPESPGGLVVPNTDQLVLEPPAVRRAMERAQGANARLAPAPEAPQLDLLRRQAAPPEPPPPASPPEAASLPAAGPPPQAAAPPPAIVQAPPVPIAAPAAAPVPKPPATTSGRAVVQLGALGSEEAARAEWARLQRRVPGLAGRQPQVTRLDRGEGRAPLYRLRTVGLPDADAARALCEAVRAQSGACVVVGGGGGA